MSKPNPNRTSRRKPAKAQDESTYFYTCSCGQAVDRRDPAQVVYHETQPEHGPLPHNWLRDLNLPLSDLGLRSLRSRQFLAESQSQPTGIADDCDAQ
jgi:hypothetical protein